ncbi:Fe superoxide dismutase-like protein [Paraphoma chrysanthemicola]|nr:Fe superoxide dismutase-like protein [Paraphoma chrysanthemicola]
MIIRCLAQRPGALQPLARASCRAPRCTRTYTVPTLLNHNDLQRHGIPGLFSRKGFNTAYTAYQRHIIDELNASTDGTTYENQEPKSLVIEFARDPTKAYAFNVASMAFNNHFFFRGINVNPDVQSQPSQDLTAQIRKDFSSVDTLRETFLSTAEAMFGPGFVWLVQTNDSHIGSLRILPTYLAGSPLSGAHYRRQSHDLTTHNADSYQALNKVGSFGAAAKQNTQPKKPLGGVDVIPLLCVNTWEHVWLQDFGVLGKRKYLEAWWDKIDWGFVRDNATLISRNDQTPKQFEYD